VTRAWPHCPHPERRVQPRPRELACHSWPQEGSTLPQLMLSTQPPWMAVLRPATCQGLPCLSSSDPQKCHYSLFTDHEMEARGCRG
jgi:hypothetical protein